MRRLHMWQGAAAFPRMLPSASLSESVVFVARFAHGYRVWHIAH
jgi:hypothetical protein